MAGGAPGLGPGVARAGRARPRGRDLRRLAAQAGPQRVVRRGAGAGGRAPAAPRLGRLGAAAPQARPGRQEPEPRARPAEEQAAGLGEYSHFVYGYFGLIGIRQCATRERWT